MSDSLTDGRLVFLPLGGSGEIGMNLNLYGMDGQWLMIDLGITFGDDRAPGVDIVMPDPGFIVDRRDKLSGIVLTHGHEDHLGAVQYLWPRLRCPVYATPFTAALLKRKLAETDFRDAVPIRQVPLSSRFTVGPFDLELVTLTHSIPEPNGVVVRTPYGTVLHTGDWKIDPEPLLGDVTDETALRALGGEGVLAMVCDSTNAMVPGEAGSEATVRDNLMELVGRYDTRVAISQFASNVARLETLAHVAQAHGRTPVLVGRSLMRMVEAAREAGYMREIPPFLEARQARDLPRERVLLICTGSQGEPRAALSRIARDDHPHIWLEEGDVVVFSSRVIPGNERAIGALQNDLVTLGVEIVTDRGSNIHVSGHPARDELQRMYDWVRPSISVPVHGERRHMAAHAKLARERQVQHAMLIENGDALSLAPGEPEVLEMVDTGRLALDGDRLLPVGASAFRERKKLLYGGVGLVSVLIASRQVWEPEVRISLQGLLEASDSEEILDDLEEAVERALDRLGNAERKNDSAVADAARQSLRRAVQARFGKRPVVEVHVLRG